MSAYTVGSSPSSRSWKRSDIMEAMQLWHLWIFMGLQDVKRRYRGSVLGPIWLAGGIAALSLGIGTLYANILDVESDNFLPFVVTGITIWTFIAICVAEGCAQFFENGSLIKDSALPVNLHSFRLVWRNLLLLGHNAVVVGAVFIYAGHGLSLVALLTLPGLMLLVVNMWWVSVLAGLLATRFRDVGQIIAYLMQFAMFVTPIFWYPGMVGDRHLAVWANPFFHLLEIVRSPLLGDAPAAASWIFAGTMAVAGVFAAWIAQRLFIKRVAFWV